MSEKDLLRIGILLVGLLLLAAIWFFGRNPLTGEGALGRATLNSPGARTSLWPGACKVWSGPRSLH